MGDLLNANFLFASLIWGSIGFGYFIYGRKQASWVPLAGGILMMVASYFIGSALLMSLVGLGIMVLVYVLLRKGW
jgi:hypothetical protein